MADNASAETYIYFHYGKPGNDVHELHEKTKSLSDELENMIFVK
jgi:hypothetical protein